MSILRNPTKAEVHALLREHEFLRVLQDANGDVYVWPGALADHGSMAEHLNLDVKAKNRGRLFGPEDIEDYRELFRDDGGD